MLIDAGVTGSTITADLMLDGSVIFNVVGSSLADSGNISGSGSLTKYSAGAVAL